MLMRYLIPIFVLLVMATGHLTGQIVSTGQPRNNFSEELQNLIPVYELPEFDVDVLINEDEEYSEKYNFKKLRFAKLFDVYIDLKKEGHWINNNDGSYTCYYKIYSKDAFAISIQFSYFYLQEGDRLFIYDIDRKHVVGAMTSQNNKSSKTLAVMPVRGEEIIIEYTTSDISSGKLIIGQIGHDYRGVYSLFRKSTAGFGASGFCNVDINCDEGNMWQTEKNAVAKILFNGYICTGSLINNTLHDETPYFLTAQHCIEFDFDAQNAIFYFNYESAECNGDEGTLEHTISGSEIVAKGPGTSLDFTLLKLSEKPPAHYNPFYAGWNRDSITNAYSVSIHHPSGDVKKISIDEDPLIVGDFGGGYNSYSHWNIYNWEVGTTEGGSSGSPLFDANHRIIGDLTGGDASCLYNFNDYYAMLHRSWDEYPDSISQLAYWLDPVQSDEIYLDGYLPYDTIPSDLKAVYFDSAAQLTWNETTDTINHTRYYIYKNNALLDSTANTFYADTAVEQSTLYKYFIKATNDEGSILSDPSNDAFIFRNDTLEIPYLQNFEQKDSIPALWYEKSSTGDALWEFKDGGSVYTSSAYEGALNAVFRGGEDSLSILVSPKFNLDQTNKPMLFFYYALPFANDINHILNVYYRSHDSLTWRLLKAFTERANEWTQTYIPVPDTGKALQFAFEGVGSAGGGVYLDSIYLFEDTAYIDPEFTADRRIICSGDTVLFSSLTPKSKNNFQWFFEGGESESLLGFGPHEVVFNEQGFKTIQLQLNDKYIDRKPRFIYVYPSPSIPDFVASGSKLTADEAYLHQWYMDGEPISGATTNEYTVEETGYYSVGVINEYGCETRSVEKYIVYTSVEDEVSEEKGFLVFPNPAVNMVEVQYNFRKGMNVLLTDISGKVLFVREIQENRCTIGIDVEDIPAGIYFVELQGNSISESRKLIITK